MKKLIMSDTFLDDLEIVVGTAFIRSLCFLIGAAIITAGFLGLAVAFCMFWHMVVMEMVDAPSLNLWQSFAIVCWLELLTGRFE